MFAARKGRTEAAALLLEKGANLNASDKARPKAACSRAVPYARCVTQDGKTALYHAPTEAVRVVLTEAARVRDQKKRAAASELTDWLLAVQLEQYERALVETLGVALRADLRLLTEPDLESVGMKVVERRRFLAKAKLLKDEL
jgi:ABC-type Fe3+ transport system substrate-binding protein